VRDGEKGPSGFVGAEQIIERVGLPWEEIWAHLDVMQKQNKSDGGV
jgi:hypothetical protein